MASCWAGEMSQRPLLGVVHEQLQEIRCRALERIRPKGSMPDIQTDPQLISSNILWGQAKSGQVVFTYSDIPFKLSQTLREMDRLTEDHESVLRPLTLLWNQQRKICQLVEKEFYQALIVTLCSTRLWVLAKQTDWLTDWETFYM